jgi:hypothetical protein
MISQGLLEQLNKLRAKRNPEGAWKFTYPEWSQQQMDFLTTVKNKMILRASRRSGKTVAIAERMLKVVNTPRVFNGVEVYGTYVFVTMTKSDAKNIIWAQLKEMCRLRGLAYTSHEVDLKMTFPSGGEIRLEGAGLAESSNRARGKKFVGVAIDEAAFISTLKDLVMIYGPTLADYDGEIVLSSSPGPSTAGFFYAADCGNEREHWQQFYLKPEDNPAFKGGKYEKFRAEQLATVYGGNANHPNYRREWLGEFVIDSSAILFKYDKARNFIAEPHVVDHSKFVYVVGLDLGYLDSTAITVAAVHRFEPYMVYIDEFEQSELRITEILKLVEFYVEKYRAEITVVDSGGFGQHTFQELQRKEGLGAIVPASKAHKKLAIERMNDSFYSGHIKVAPTCPKLIESWEKILKDPVSHLENERVDYGASYVIDLADSALYAYGYSSVGILEQLAEKLSWEEEHKERKFKAYSKQKKEMERHGISDIFTRKT